MEGRSISRRPSEIPSSRFVLDVLVLGILLTISQSIRGAKIKMVNTRTVQSDKISRLSNIHAALLNIGLLNSYSELPDLRGAAYDLIRTICSSMNFAEAENWLRATGAFWL